MEEMLDYRPKLIEFHLAEKDLSTVPRLDRNHTQELVVHAPEYMGDHLLDLCSGDEKIRKDSLAVVYRTLRITADLAPHFQGIPKVIVHPGAMSLNTKLDRDSLKDALKRSVDEIDATGVELLLENLPPYPWYFGGQWKGNFFMDAEEIHSFCKENGISICFDLSHAALYCNAKELDLADYIRTVLPHTAHIHFADGYGLDGEGVQIGGGDIDFDRIMPLFSDYQGTWVPEVWRGHLEGGRGFLEALRRLKPYGI